MLALLGRRSGPSVALHCVKRPTSSLSINCLYARSAHTHTHAPSRNFKRSCQQEGEREEALLLLLLVVSSLLATPKAADSHGDGDADPQHHHAEGQRADRLGVLRLRRQQVGREGARDSSTSFSLERARRSCALGKGLATHARTHERLFTSPRLAPKSETPRLAQTTKTTPTPTPTTPTPTPSRSPANPPKTKQHPVPARRLPAGVVPAAQALRPVHDGHARRGADALPVHRVQADDG